MSDEIVLAFVGFMSSVVVFFTALVGYIKISKPASRQIVSAEGRIDDVVKDLNDSKAQIAGLEHDVSELKKNYRRARTKDSLFVAKTMHSCERI